MADGDTRMVLSAVDFMTFRLYAVFRQSTEAPPVENLVKGLWK